MEHSWTDQLLGRTVEAVERWEALPCVVKLSGGYRLQIEGLWRLLADGSLARTGEDDGQSFGHKSPVDAISDLSVGLIGCALHSVEVVPGTADLILSFGHHVLHMDVAIPHGARQEEVGAGLSLSLSLSLYLYLPDTLRSRRGEGVVGPVGPVGVGGLGPVAGPVGPVGVGPR